MPSVLAMQTKQHRSYQNQTVITVSWQEQFLTLTFLNKDPDTISDPKYLTAASHEAFDRGSPVPLSELTPFMI